MLFRFAVLLITATASLPSLAAAEANVAAALEARAEELYKVGRFLEATTLVERALAMEEAAAAPNQSKIARLLNDLGVMYTTSARFSNAEPMFRRALAIRERALGPDDPAVAATLNNLATLLSIQPPLQQS
jgi:tetratricopeptide (TPR) repeat protein